MPALAPSVPVAVIGAGTMGAGIAQVAAAAGHVVLLYDAEPSAGAARSTSPERWRARSSGPPDAGGARPRACRIKPLEPRCAGAGRPGDRGDRRRSRGQGAPVRDAGGLLSAEAIFASNTSSLSITALAAGLKQPERMVGMHFFNPAPVMTLVEVVRGLASAPQVVETVRATAAAWGKTPVVCRSTPGFIVNRVARPFYGEALRALAEGAADIATIDAVMRARGFRMGPFELIDLIGLDVNLAVSRSIHAAYSGDPRYTPSLLQQELVEAGRRAEERPRFLRPCRRRRASRAAHRAAGATADAHRGRGRSRARRTADRALAQGRHRGRPALGRGPDPDRECAPRAHRRPRRHRMEPSAAGAGDPVRSRPGFRHLRAPCVGARRSGRRRRSCPGRRADAGGRYHRLRDRRPPGDAGDAHGVHAGERGGGGGAHGRGERGAVDQAMRLGVNYPRGPLAWAEAIGLERVRDVLDHLARTYGEDRYRASWLLRRKALAKRSFHD